MARDAFYVVVRMLHLFLVAGTMPLGLWHWLSAHPDGVFAALLLPVFLAGGLLALFVIALDQADYPLGFLGALRRTGPLAANAGAALWAGHGDVFAAAHWTLSALFTALAGTFVVVVVVVRGEQASLARKLGAPIALLAGAVTALIAWPMVVSATLSLSTIVASIAWLAHVGFTVYAWMRQSTLFPRTETASSSERVAAFERRFTAPAAATIFLVLAAEAIELVLYAR